jgi:glucosylceramidase
MKTERNLKRGELGNDQTRREFLKTAGLAAAGIAAQSWIGNAADALLPGHEWKTWLTNDDLRLSPVAPTAWTSVSRLTGGDVLTISPDRKYQPILGFGAAFTDGACYLFNELSPTARKDLFHTLFHPSAMALNVCRTCIGSSDNAATLYSFDDGDADPELKRFSIEHDRAYTLPMLRQARAVNPDLFLFSSPWSPPGWMKDNGSMLGGCMRHTYMPAYAKYFVKFLRAYEAEGVPVQAITVQNEVDADQQGLMPACFWPQDYEADFVRFHLGPEFEQSSVNTKIWIIDHNYNLWGRAIAELETDGVRKYTNAIAWHGYTGEPEWMSRVQNAFPDLEMYWTEGSPDHNDPEYQKCWAAWGQKITAILGNSCRSVTGWSFATDERGQPNIGPYPLGGMITIDSKTEAIYHSGQFWAMGHFSRFIRRGAVRIHSEASAKDLHHSAFQNLDGSLVLVLTNPGATRTCQVRLLQQAATITLPGNSMMTLTSA